MKNKFFNKISFKLLIAITVSFFVAMVVLTLLSQFLNLYYIKDQGENLNWFRYNLVFLSISLVTIVSFILTFLLFIRKKIKYLNHITDKVQRMTDENLDSTIEVRGQDELGQLSRNINEMASRLKEKLENERQIEKTKNELITNVSHDLRTPLTSISGYVDLLRKEQFKDAGQAKDYLETIHVKTENLKSLINELFEYTRLSSPGIELSMTDVDIAALIDQMTGEYIPIFQNSGMQIQSKIASDELYTKVDIEKIVRVFENLIENALKYGDKQSVAIVTLEKKGEHALFSIANKTVHFTAAQMDQLFLRFYRGDSSREKNKGSGLGLAIAKTITELHGGVIWAVYTDDWLTFYVQLPILRNVKN